MLEMVFLSAFIFYSVIHNTTEMPIVERITHDSMMGKPTEQRMRRFTSGFL